MRSYVCAYRSHRWDRNANTVGKRPLRFWAHDVPVNRLTTSRRRHVRNIGSLHIIAAGTHPSLASNKPVVEVPACMGVPRQHYEGPWPTWCKPFVCRATKIVTISSLICSLFGFSNNTKSKHSWISSITMTSEWISEWVNESMNEWVNESMNEWVNEWVRKKVSN